MILNCVVEGRHTIEQSYYNSIANCFLKFKLYHKQKQNTVKPRYETEALIQIDISSDVRGFFLSAPSNVYFNVLRGFYGATTKLLELLKNTAQCLTAFSTELKN